MPLGGEPRLLLPGHQSLSCVATLGRPFVGFVVILLGLPASDLTTFLGIRGASFPRPSDQAPEHGVPERLTPEVHQRASLGCINRKNISKRGLRE